MTDRDLDPVERVVMGYVAVAPFAFIAADVLGYLDPSAGLIIAFIVLNAVVVVATIKLYWMATGKEVSER